MSAASPDCSNIDSASIHSGSVITEGAAMSGCIDSASATEQLCYVHCNFCSTILAVSVPSSSLFKIVTVRCGHCNHLLSVNMMGASPPLEAGQIQNDYSKDSASSSASSTVSERTANSYAGNEAAKMFSSMPPEKRQRVPSVYNRFIKEEIQRIKAKNPDIRHKEAFSAAAKNWAHFPHIHFGLMLENNKQATMEKGNLREGTQIGTVKDGRMTTNLC